MSSLKGKIVKLWTLFSAQEKRNIGIYILGIMLYKFGLEAFNGAIITLATNRYDQDAYNSGTPSRTFEKVGLISGLNQAFQCVGSILIAPLIKRWPTRTVLSVAIFVFAIFTAILMIVDAATGGRIKPADFNQTHKDDFSYYGRYNTDGIIPIYCMAGISYGMVELIRRVIPRDIVGGDSRKLQRMDALVHIFYEVSGTAGAFTTALALIPRLGNNYAFIITPIFFTAAAIVWFFISPFRCKTTDPEDSMELDEEESKRNYFISVIKRFFLFGKSVYTGAKIVFTNRKFIWLWSGYSLALYGHRYLENGIAPQIAKRYLGNSEWSQIIVGGSNFGELLGAFAVFLCANIVQTPIPWLRLDALLLLIIWYIPYYYPPVDQVKYAWIIAATFIPISFGWAAGDVSLGAYIQSSLDQQEATNKNVSPLGAVMAFLYSSYIIIYAIANPLLGKYIDSVYNSTGTVRPALLNTAAIQLTIICGIVFISTFIPKGAIALNPKLLDEAKVDTTTTNNIENSTVIYDKTMGSGQSVHKKIGQNMQQENNFDINTYF
jgi:MFS family permease